MEEEKFTDGFKGEGEMLERGGGAHLSSHSHIPGASASSGPPLWVMTSRTGDMSAAGLARLKLMFTVQNFF